MEGEQLVRQQEDPIQEEHCQSPGGGQHVRGEGGGLRGLPHWVTRTHDVPPLPVGRLTIFWPVLSSIVIKKQSCSELTPKCVLLTEQGPDIGLALFLDQLWNRSKSYHVNCQCFLPSINILDQAVYWLIRFLRNLQTTKKINDFPHFIDPDSSSRSKRREVDTAASLLAPSSIIVTTTTLLQCVQPNHLLKYLIWYVSQCKMVKYVAVLSNFPCPHMTALSNIQ